MTTTVPSDSLSKSGHSLDLTNTRSQWHHSFSFRRLWKWGSDRRWLIFEILDLPQQTSIVNTHIGVMCADTLKKPSSNKNISQPKSSYLHNCQRTVSSRSYTSYRRSDLSRARSLRRDQHYIVACLACHFQRVGSSGKALCTLYVQTWHSWDTRLDINLLRLCLSKAALTLSSFTDYY